MKNISTKQLSKIVEVIGWCSILGWALYYTIVVLVPFYGKGIYRLSPLDIAQSPNVIFTSEELFALDIGCMGTLLMLGVGLVVFLQWRAYTRMEKRFRAAILAAVSIPIILSAISFSQLSAWLLD